MIQCAIGIMLLLTSFFFSIINTNDDIFIEFNSMLDDHQIQIYKKIIQERIYIYISGSLIGFILAMMYYYISNATYKMCSCIAIFYICQLLYYKIYPKHPLMLYYLTNKKQVNKWADIYIYMKRKWNISFILSFVGFLIFYLGLRI